MKTIRFTIAAVYVTLVVWYYNFSSRHRSKPVQRINPDNVYVHPGKQHILVTGGAGFIGSHATLHLLEEGHSVTVFDNLSRGNLGALYVLAEEAQDRFKFVNVDLGDKPKLLLELQALHPKVDLVIHFAAVAYVGESTSEPLKYYHNITINTNNLLECMKEVGILKLVYSSTCAVYGNPDQLPVTELTPPRPINPYGSAKLYAENIIRDTAKALPAFNAVILRYFNVYGSDPQGRLGEYPRPELRRHCRVSGACLDAALGVTPHLTITGTTHPTHDGTAVRDYIHVWDLVKAHVLAMSHASNPPALFNVGTGKGVSVREFVAACKKVTGAAISVVEQADPRPGDYAEVWADVSKIEKELGWRANITSVEEGLAHAWSWRRTHPEGY